MYKLWRNPIFLKPSTIIVIISVRLTTKSGPGVGPTTKNEILHRMANRFHHKKFWEESIYKLWRNLIFTKTATIIAIILVWLSTKSGPGVGPTTKNEILHRMTNRFRHKKKLRQTDL